MTTENMANQEKRKKIHDVTNRLQPTNGSKFPVFNISFFSIEFKLFFMQVIE